MNNQTRCFYIRLEPYIKDWIIKRNGVNGIIDFKRGSMERDFIMLNAAKLPKGKDPDTPDDECVAVKFHWYRGKNPVVYNYFSDSNKEELKAMLKRRFDWQLMMDILKPSNHGCQISELVWNWMQQNNIELNDRNFNAIIKRFQRRRNYYGIKISVRQKKSKKKG